MAIAFLAPQRFKKRNVVFKRLYGDFKPTVLLCLVDVGLVAPETIIHTRVGIEDVILGFGVGGVSSNL